MESEILVETFENVPEDGVTNFSRKP